MSKGVRGDGWGWVADLAFACERGDVTESQVVHALLVWARLDRKDIKILRTLYFNMRGRCENKDDARYKDYGGRGIYICERWRGPLGFFNLAEDIGPRPSDDLSLDRIDNDGPYAPDNVRWADSATQFRNQRSNVLFLTAGGKRTRKEVCDDRAINPNTVKYRMNVLGWDWEKATTVRRNAGGHNAELVTLDGVEKRFVDHCNDHGINVETARDRRVNGWTLEDAIKTPSDSRHGKRRMVTIEGRTQPISTWAKEFKIPWSTVTSRLNRGWTPEKALGQ